MRDNLWDTQCVNQVMNTKERQACCRTKETKHLDKERYEQQQRCIWNSSGHVSQQCDQVTSEAAKREGYILNA